MGRVWSVICILLLGVLCSCAVVRDPIPDNAVYISDYKTIPGVTQEEIQAIEALQADNIRFTYGTLSSGEAFERRDGSRGGFSILFCAMLTKMFDIPFEHKFYDVDTLIADLNSGELDFTGELTATEERLQQYVMTSAILERTIKIFTNHHAGALREGTKEHPLQLAVLEGAVTGEQVKSRIQQPVEFVYVPDYHTAAELIRTQTVDAFFEEAPAAYHFEEYDFIQTRDYYPLIYSPVSMATANPAFKPIIDVLQKYLESGGITHLANLYSEGSQDYLRHKLDISLSEEERAYICERKAKGESVPIVAESDNYPISFYNEREKEFQGVALDVLKEISELTGLSFQPVSSPEDSWTKNLADLESGKAALMTGIVHMAGETGTHLHAEGAFFNDQSALLTTASYPDIEMNQISYAKAGLVAGNPYSDMYRVWFPNSTNYQYFNTSDEAFRALQKGQIDFLLASQSLLLSQTNYREKPGFRSNLLFGNSVPTSFGLYEQEHNLQAVISKAQGLVPTDAISDRWTHKTFDYRSKMIRDVVPYLLVFILVLTVSLALLFWQHVKNRRLGKQLEELVQVRTQELQLRTQELEAQTCALSLQTATLTTIFSAIPDMVFCKDLNGIFTQCNNSFARYFNLTPEEVIGKNDAILFNMERELYESYLLADREVAESKTIKVFEEEIYSPYHGKARLFETIKTPLLQNGKSIGTMGLARDVTDRKASEEAARVASQAKSDFLARMSHEIRTPLNAIIGMTKIAQQSIADQEKALQSLEEIATASNHLLGVLNGILDMSKIESGKFEILQEPFHLSSTIAEVSSIVSQWCKDKYIVFRHNPEVLPAGYLLGDKLRLKQVLINLLGNAVKFTSQEGNIELRMDVLEDTVSVLTLAFTVADDGIGMSEEQMQRLFVPFDQTDANVFANYGGTGLGLAISQNLVNLMGGLITVTSNPDVGATFHFVLSFPKTDEEIALSPKTRTDDLTLKGKRILVVEDIEINRIIIQELLTPTGVSLDEAVDGQQAADIFGASGVGYYDLILMDIQMPVMDGYEATRLIRTLGRPDAKTVPIIAMTANAYQEDVDKALAVGMNGHLAKPIDLDIVLAVLRDFLVEG